MGSFSSMSGIAITFRRLVFRVSLKWQLDEMRRRLHASARTPFALTLLLAIALWAAHSQAQTVIKQDVSVTTEIAPAARPTDPGYRVGTGDQLHVTVYNETDLSGDYSVDDGGYLRLPLIGQIKVAGLTLVELESTIADKYGAGYLKSPKISAQVTSYRPFYIIGEVNKPGQYSYVNGMNVLTAVALAGGYTYRADESDVYVRRNGATEEESVPADQTTTIKPGDIIRVSERFF
jgi:protein involved in polysaccharide export with SLBB domain